MKHWSSSRRSEPQKGIEGVLLMSQLEVLQASPKFEMEISVRGGKEDWEPKTVLGVLLSSPFLHPVPKPPNWFGSSHNSCSNKYEGNISASVIWSNWFWIGFVDVGEVIRGVISEELRRHIGFRSWVLLGDKLGLLAEAFIVPVAEPIREVRYWILAACIASDWSLAAWSSQGDCWIIWRRFARAISCGNAAKKSVRGRWVMGSKPIWISFFLRWVFQKFLISLSVLPGRCFDIADHLKFKIIPTYIYIYQPN